MGKSKIFSNCFVTNPFEGLEMNIFLVPSLSGNTGHSVPHSPDKTEHPRNEHKNLTFMPLKPNIGWVKFSVFGGPNHLAHPI
ncbi:hypothetical protein [Flagellimonas sp.]|uniref:hypothetical protein n=1 Tax=Flagellimonas sp. TaxID=2058762 RepID=UPI003AB65412